MTLLDNFNVDAVFTRSVVKCLHPGISADITDEKRKLLGFLGELHPTVCANFEINKRVYVAQIDLEKLKESKSKSPNMFRFRDIRPLTEILPSS